jgi:hypothetical protein
MMLFLVDVGVKENRKSLLCKRSGGAGENRGSEDAPYKSGNGRLDRGRGRLGPGPKGGV